MCQLKNKFDIAIFVLILRTSRKRSIHLISINSKSRLADTSNHTIKKIVQDLQLEFGELKKQHSLLKNQDLLGFLFFGVSIGSILLSVYLWNLEIINTWILVFWIAFWTSILHELEHDLIHGLYFPKNKLVHNFMLFFVWFFRPLTLNPWIRRYWHNYHHQHSGQVIDIEERGVTNGEKWSVFRLLITPDLVLGFLLRFQRIRREIMEEYAKGNFSKRDLKKLRQTILVGLLPFGIPLTFLFYFWLGYHILSILSILNIGKVEAIIFMDSIISPIMYVFVIPNFIRQFCLHFITSNMHYYGDVEHGNIIQQTQVLNIWWTWPFQLFCFNFGATHSIHHFVVNETFYNRQLIMRKAHAIMKAGGVHFNDVQSFWRKNNYHKRITN